LPDFSRRHVIIEDGTIESPFSFQIIDRYFEPTYGIPDHFHLLDLLTTYRMGGLK
jgi:hypothetical protein